MSFSGILDEFIAGLASGALLLLGGYLFVNRKFHLADRRDREAEAIARRQEMGRAVVDAIHAELVSNYKALRRWDRIFGDRRVPHLPLRMNGERLIFEPVALDALPKGWASSLISIYRLADELNGDVARLAELREEAAASDDRLDAAESFQEGVRSRMDSLGSNLKAAAAVLGKPIDDD